MKKKYLVAGACTTGLIGILLGFMLAKSFIPKDYIPPIKITGDVKHELTVRSLADISFDENILYKGEKYKSIRLSDLLPATQPLATEGSIYFMTGDSFVASIALRDANNSYLSFSEKNGWEVVNPLLPVSSNAKQIQSLIVVADADEHSGAVSVIGNGSKTDYLQPGKLAVSSPQEFLRHEGNAVVKHGGKSYTSNVYTKHKILGLADVLGISTSSGVNVYGRDGQCINADLSDSIDVSGNRLNLLQQGDTTITDICGIIINPTNRSVADAYYDAGYYLRSQRPVLLLMQEGASYEQVAAAVGKLEMKSTIDKKLEVATGIYPTTVKAALNGIVNDVASSDGDIFKQAGVDKSVAIVARDWPIKLGRRYVIKQASDASVSDMCQIAENKLHTGMKLVVVRLPNDSSNALHGNLQTTDRLIGRLKNNWNGVIIYAGIPRSATSSKNSALEFTKDNMQMAYALIESGNQN